MIELKLLPSNFIFKGNVYWQGELTEAYVYIENGKIVDFMEEQHKCEVEGTLLPKFFNAHVHILDSACDVEPPRDLLRAVGPEGHKWKFIIPPDWNSYKETLVKMFETGTGYYVEFHESPYAYIAKLMSREIGMQGIILGRRESFPDGVGWSTALGKPPNANGILGLHHSEGYHEDIEIAISYKPHHLVHMNHATYSDLKRCLDENIPIVVTPRSYLYFSLPIRIREMIDVGLNVLVGTDNVMISSADMRIEAEIFWRVSKLDTKSSISYLFLPYQIFLGRKVLNIGEKDWMIFPTKNIYKLVKNWSLYEPLLYREKYEICCR